jgi:hypothetical protein
MAGLYPAIHVKPIMRRKTWMTGTSPVMTAEFPDERSLLSS